jgi:hypothetical protein
MDYPENEHESPHWETSTYMHELLQVQETHESVQSTEGNKMWSLHIRQGLNIQTLQENVVELWIQQYWYVSDIDDNRMPLNAYKMKMKNKQLLGPQQ